MLVPVAFFDDPQTDAQVSIQHLDAHLRNMTEADMIAFGRWLEIGQMPPGFALDLVAIALTAARWRLRVEAERRGMAGPEKPKPTPAKPNLTIVPPKS